MVLRRPDASNRPGSSGRSSIIPVGVVGLSPAWESRYRPALKSLAGRMAVRAVYDPVPVRAESAAAEFDATVATGMAALTRRSDLRAVLVLDAGWAGADAVRLMCRSGRPLFVGGSLAADEAALERLGQTAAACGTTLMPELGQRYTPATGRLRELLATRLGRPDIIEISAAAPAVPSGGQPLGRRPLDEFLARLFDWCCYLIPTPPVELMAAADGPTGPEEIALTFAASRAGRGSPTVVIRIRTADPNIGPDQPPPVVYRVVCERGQAELPSPTQIRWQAGGESAEESLTSDRSDLQVMLDHFCRRVVGGLIPVADLADVRRSRSLVRAVQTSLRTGQAVRLP